MTKLRHFLAGALTGALAILLLIAADNALAQSACAPADQIILQLEGPNYGEALFFGAAARTSRGMVPIRFYANAKTGTWTMLTMPAPGVACLVGTGNGFAPPKPKGTPSSWSAN